MSVGWIVRPTTGGTPRKLNALPERRTPPKLSGANSPVMSTVSIEVAITSANAGTSAGRAQLVERVAVAAATVDGARLRGPDFSGPGVRIGRDEHAVDHAEDGRGRADAERQRQQRDQHERRAAPKRSNGVAEVLPERFQPASHTRPLLNCECPGLRRTRAAFRWANVASLGPRRPYYDAETLAPAHSAWGQAVNRESRGRGQDVNRFTA